MHRSGTSAITRGLQALGVSLGDHLMPAAAGVNDKGFWEDLDIYSLNIDLLHALGRDWHTLCPITESDFSNLPTLTQFQQRAQELLIQKLSDCKHFGLKDPRIPRLLSFWKTVFKQTQLSPGYIIAYRNPVNVAHSLAKRNSFDFEKSHQLWYEHMLHSLALTTHQPRLVVNFDAMIEDPASQLQRMASILGLTFDPQSCEYFEYKNQFLDSSLRHTRFQSIDLELDSTASASVKELNELLLQLSDDTISLNDASLQSHIGIAYEKLNRQQHELRYMQKLDDRSTQLSATGQQQLSQILELHSLIQSRDSTISTLEQKLSEASKEMSDLNFSYGKLEKEFQELHESLTFRIVRGIRSAFR